MRIIGCGLVIGLIVAIAGCATSRPVAAGHSSTEYNEDLALVRPVYKVTGAEPTTKTTPARSVSTPVSISTASSATPATRKPDIRKSTGPVEALHINRQLDMVLDTIATQNRSMRYAAGFRIQVYIGTQRQEVENLKRMLSQNFPELSPYLSYTQPTYKLKVGDFMRRLDAERYYTSVRQLIASARLEADKVDVRRSLLIK